MYCYEYVPLRLGGGIGGMILDTGSRRHRALIDQYAREGWRYAGYLPTAFSGHGIASEIELIFEREDGDAPC